MKHSRPLPEEFTDQAAAELLELLYHLAHAIETAHAPQFRRHYQQLELRIQLESPRNENQLELFDPTPHWPF